MPLRNAVLAALLEGEASGYDLAKGFDASVANFWMSTPQQLYKELEKMAADGLIETRVEQERRPTSACTRSPRQGEQLYNGDQSRPCVFGAGLRCRGAITAASDELGRLAVLAFLDRGTMVCS